MKYDKVFIESFGYELAPHIVTSREIDEKLAPFLRLWDLCRASWRR